MQVVLRVQCGILYAGKYPHLRLEVVKYKLAGLP